MSIYSPEVIAYARDNGITELQAYRYVKARNYIRANRLSPYNPDRITVLAR